MTLQLLNHRHVTKIFEQNFVVFVSWLRTTQGRTNMSTPRVRHILETSVYCDDLGRTAGFYKQLLDSVPMPKPSAWSRWTPERVRYCCCFSAAGRHNLFRRQKGSCLPTTAAVLRTSPSRSMPPSCRRGKPGWLHEGFRSRVASNGRAEGRACTSAIPTDDPSSLRRPVSGQRTNDRMPTGRATR